MMEAGVYMELEEVKEVEYPMETEFCQRLKIEEQLGEICGTAVEVFEAQRNCAELKSGFVEKEMILGKVTSRNERGRAGLEEKVEILEGCNRYDVNALKETEDKLCAGNEENHGFILLATENKCSEVEMKVYRSNDLCCKDELIARLEEEFRNALEKSKLKSEQFSLLEEEHKKLRGEFQSSKLEWEKERLVVHGKISSLQSSLDSQMRVSNCLQTKLKMCNQALAHEESRRKLVEVQLSESQALFENIYAKCLEEQAKIDQSTAQRDEEVTSLRYLLATKDILLKEMEYKNLELKQQKEEMNASLKEFQEAEIKYAASFQSLTKLQKKFGNLEQVHGSCSTNLELKEMEWTSQLERLETDAKEYLSELSNKETEIFDLSKELEMCQFSLHGLNEEMDVVVMLLKSEYSEAYLKLLGEYETNQNQIFMLTKDLENSKNMLEESQRKQRQLEEYVQEVETVNKADLAEKTHEINLIKAELQKLKNDAENLKSSLVEAQEIHKQTRIRLELQLENQQASKQEEIESLKIAGKEHERTIDVLQQQVTSLETALVVKNDTLEVLELKNKSYIGIIEELESKNMRLNENISGLVIDWQNILGAMEGAANQLHEIYCQDESLLAEFRNTDYAAVEMEQIMCNEISSHGERNEAISFSPAKTKLQMRVNERVPLQEINY